MEPGYVEASASAGAAAQAAGEFAERPTPSAPDMGYDGTRWLVDGHTGGRGVRMARSGDVRTNPRGDRLVFVRTAAETAGELLEMEATYAARGAAPPLHLHPHQEETFRVLEGALRTTIGGDPRRFVAGETFVVPPGTPHTMHADADGPTRFTWQVRPALATEDFFATMWGLASAGRTDAGGTPNLLQAAVLMRAYGREFRLLRPPRWIQVPVFAVLAALGHVAGYRARFEPDGAAVRREPPAGA